MEVISASPSPRVSSAGAGSTTAGSTRKISRVRSVTTPTAFFPIDSTTTFPASSSPLSAGNPNNARNDTSGRSWSRNVTTPSTAVSGRGTCDICFGN